MRFIALHVAALGAAFAVSVVFAETSDPKAVDVRSMEPSAAPAPEATVPGTLTRDQRKAATLKASEAGELKLPGEAAVLRNPPSHVGAATSVVSPTPAPTASPALAAPPQEATAAKGPRGVSTNAVKAKKAKPQKKKTNSGAPRSPAHAASSSTR